MGPKRLDQSAKIHCDLLVMGNRNSRTTNGKDGDEKEKGKMVEDNEESEDKQGSKETEKEKEAEQQEDKGDSDDDSKENDEEEEDASFVVDLINALKKGGTISKLLIGMVWSMSLLKCYI